MFFSSLLSMKSLSLYFFIITSHEYYDLGAVIIAAIAVSVAKISALFDWASFLKTGSSKVSTLNISPVKRGRGYALYVLALSS